MNHPFIIPILIPIILGIFCLLIPKKIRNVRETLALSGSVLVFVFTTGFFFHRPEDLTAGQSILFGMDQLNRFILPVSGLFGILVVMYSIQFMRDNPNSGLYYSALLWTMGAVCGTLLANHLVLLLMFWGILGITLYLLVLTGGEGSGGAAKKTLFMMGGSEAFLLFGIVMIYRLSGSFEINRISISLNGFTAYAAYAFLAIGAFAKAGAVPLHTWMPDAAEKAPIPVTAYLPAALDKLLGIYLLARMSLNLFEMTYPANAFLIITGAATVLIAVMMALVQHDLKKLLAYHAVSQVGYMLLGIGSGNPIGIAGGLFHMLNHSIYKFCLFLTGGAVGYRSGTTHLDELGGLSRLMPFTFFSFLTAALAISGIPPLNGFFSKWMIYQGLIEFARTGSRLWIVGLTAAMFGSALTIASFMKVIHAVFLGIPSEKIARSKIREAGFWMSAPSVLLALLCILFGVFAFTIPIKMFISPAVPGIVYSGIWFPGWATILMIVGLFTGIIIYLSGNLKGMREADSFIGGEKIPVKNRITGNSFYRTIRELPVLKKCYCYAERKWFDIYDQSGKLAFLISGVFQKLHTGILSNYVSWSLVGFILVLLFLVWR